MRILGIDPGSRATGYGIIDTTGNNTSTYVASGVVKTVQDDFPARLKVIFDGVGQIIEQYQPHCISIEKVFVAKNADSALKLGHARGAAICAAVARDLPVFEYTAKQTKQAVVGGGSAAKNQVQHMVMMILNLSGDIQEDAADALAAAICHHNTSNTASQIKGQQISGSKKGRWQ
ncbi:MAG: crossover junction endodeoxyribonuclease RuvC [Gammaproteobacteria bacterium]|nr:MAG: crossover junction endodeoxyribonuclease RuvC [Gammaproteobacteria bacterium]